MPVSWHYWVGDGSSRLNFVSGSSRTVGDRRRRGSSWGGRWRCDFRGLSWEWWWGYWTWCNWWIVRRRWQWLTVKLVVGIRSFLLLFHWSPLVLQFVVKSVRCCLLEGPLHTIGPLLCRWQREMLQERCRLLWRLVWCQNLGRLCCRLGASIRIVGNIFRLLEGLWFV